MDSQSTNSEDSFTLQQIQKWMQSVITHPAGVHAGMVSENAKQLLGENSELEIALPSERLSAEDRLKIYSDAYIARLIECLQADFPALQHAVGDETFGSFVVGYLQKFPSTSYTLADLSQHFPDYLNEIRPEETKGTDEPNWADFLIDLATLELCYNEVFDLPGEEQIENRLNEQILELDEERWPLCRLIPSKTLRLMELQFPIHEYISAVRKEQEPEFPAASPTYLAISRRDYIVRRQAISEQQWKLLKELQHGKPIVEALEVFDAEEVESIAPQLFEWFKQWTAAKLFCGLETE